MELTDFSNFLSNFMDYHDALSQSKVTLTYRYHIMPAWPQAINVSPVQFLCFTAVLFLRLPRNLITSMQIVGYKYWNPNYFLYYSGYHWFQPNRTRNYQNALILKYKTKLGTPNPFLNISKRILVHENVYSCQSRNSGFFNFWNYII